MVEALAHAACFFIGWGLVEAFVELHKGRPLASLRWSIPGIAACVFVALWLAGAA